MSNKNKKDDWIAWSFIGLLFVIFVLIDLWIMFYYPGGFIGMIKDFLGIN